MANTTLKKTLVGLIFGWFAIDGINNIFHKAGSLKRNLIIPHVVICITGVVV
jgi:hypothetical protein